MLALRSGRSRSSKNRRLMESDSEGEEAEMGQRQQRSRTRSRSGPRNDQRQVVKQPFVIVNVFSQYLGRGAEVEQQRRLVNLLLPRKDMLAMPLVGILFKWG